MYSDSRNGSIGIIRAADELSSLESSRHTRCAVAKSGRHTECACYFGVFSSAARLIWTLCRLRDLILVFTQ